jgi:hypothetical protein
MYLAIITMPSMAYFRFYCMKQFNSKQVFEIYTGNNNIFPLNKNFIVMMPPIAKAVYSYENSCIQQTFRRFVTVP